MSRGLRIEFRFVPFPQEIWREGLDLTESEFKLLGYLLYHQARFGQAIIALSDDEMLNGRRHNGERVDRGCGIKGRNNLKSARQKLIERGWVDCEQDRLGMKYKIQLCEIVDEVSKTDSGVSKSDTPKGVQNGHSGCPKQTVEVSKTDTPNKEEKELHIEQEIESKSTRPIPENSETLVRRIAQAHPRHEKPIETEHAIVEQLERLGRSMSYDTAARYLLERTQLFARIASGWPRDEFRKSFPASPRWFGSACFEENESNWEWHGNGNGNSKVEQRNASNREAIIQGITGARTRGNAVPDGPAVPHGDHGRDKPFVDVDADRARAAVRPADS